MMTYLFPLLLIAAGLVLLTAGGEFLVRGASALAAALHISPLVIGLTVVAFGTSSPELAVTTTSAYSGNAEIGVGNVVGSNICNVLFILGGSALVAPLVVSSRLIRLDVPLMIAASVFTFVLALDGRLTHLDGALLFSCLIAYTVWTIRSSRQESQAVKQEYAEELGDAAPHGARSILLSIALVAGGLVMLGFGADWLVRGASTIARALGVSDLLIGLTIVAVGTSLPEAAASVVAAYRGERDIAVGNVVGSNLFNLLGVLGLASILAPQPILVSPQALHTDFPLMIAVAVACLPIFFTGSEIARWEGGLFLAFYLAYLTDLTLEAMEVDLARNFRVAMIVFVIPLTAVTLAIGVIRSLRRTKEAS